MISVIVAVDINDTIGTNSGLPWPRISEDMKWFREKTENNVVVMGRTTWESLAKYAPLPKRINVVVSSQNINGADKIISDNILDEIKLLETEYPKKEIFIIGGAMLYESTEPIIKSVYLTRIMEEYDGDATIDVKKLLQNTKVEYSESLFAMNHSLELQFGIYRKI